MLQKTNRIKFNKLLNKIFIYHFRLSLFSLLYLFYTATLASATSITPCKSLSTTESIWLFHNFDLIAYVEVLDSSRTSLNLLGNASLKNSITSISAFRSTKVNIYKLDVLKPYMSKFKINRHVNVLIANINGASKFKIGSRFIVFAKDLNNNDKLLEILSPEVRKIIKNTSLLVDLCGIINFSQENDLHLSR